MAKIVDGLTGEVYWQPDDRKPGSYVVQDDRKWQVWSAAPGGKLWLIPCHPRPGDAPVYLAGQDYRDVQPYHGDGSQCLKRCRRRHKRPSTSLAA